MSDYLIDETCVFPSGLKPNLLNGWKPDLGIGQLAPWFTTKYSFFHMLSSKDVEISWELTLIVLKFVGICFQRCVDEADVFRMFEYFPVMSSYKTSSELDTKIPREPLMLNLRQL